MKLICPHCGLKGTADDALVEKKVRCPQCRRVFRLNETNTVPAVTMSREPTAVPAAELGTCSVCGFTLSHTYLEQRDAKLYCRICLPA